VTGPRGRVEELVAEGGVPMLRRTENVEVYYKRDLWGLLTSKYKILLEVEQ
jgi:hypothetical protein